MTSNLCGESNRLSPICRVMQTHSVRKQFSHILVGRMPQDYLCSPVLKALRSTLIQPEGLAKHIY